MRTDFDDRKTCCRVKNTKIGSEKVERNWPGICPMTTPYPPIFYRNPRISDWYTHGGKLKKVEAGKNRRRKNQRDSIALICCQVLRISTNSIVAEATH